MFPGPPPPIAASQLIPHRIFNSTSKQPTQRQHPRDDDSANATRRNTGRVTSNYYGQSRVLPYDHKPDSVWRVLRRREKTLEGDIQYLLDRQATGLASGSQSVDPSFSRDLDLQSDGGSSTPTETFYSTATSKSRMPKSLYLPPVSTPDGNVIPVRQPAKSRPTGLKSARDGLRKVMSSLAMLKQEEDDLLDAALQERKESLAHLEKLGAKKAGIESELAAWDGDPDEPLGKQLRELNAQHDAVDQEMAKLEEQLSILRNRRRWLKNEIVDIKSKREAGLSGYRGALKDVNSELALVMRRPPIQPLDTAAIASGEDVEVDVPGGVEFLRLIPERRTAEMAKSWWDAEIDMLQSRRAKVDAERQALEDGQRLWSHVVETVTMFETALRNVMRNGTESSQASSNKGKETAPTEQDMIQSQILHMDRVVTDLHQAMEQAESQRWNLLICAIGAELEAFQEAHSLLKSLATPAPGVPDSKSDDDAPGGGEERTSRRLSAREESDNEVPIDFLVSGFSNDVETTDEGKDAKEEDGPEGHDGSGDHSRSQESDNDVPGEFLTEHDSHGDK